MFRTQQQTGLSARLMLPLLWAGGWTGGSAEAPLHLGHTGNASQAHPHVLPRGRQWHCARGGTLVGGIQGLRLLQGDSLRGVRATTLKEAKGCVTRPRWSPRLGASGGSLGTKLQCRKLFPLSYLWRDISPGSRKVTQSTDFCSESPPGTSPLRV